MWIAVSCITAGADLVQIAKQAMEIMDSMDDYTPIYGMLWTINHHMYAMERSFYNFESVG